MSNGKTKKYHWCEYHKLWTIHSPKECKRQPTGKYKARKGSKDKKNKYSQRKRAYMDVKAAISALTHLDIDSDDDALPQTENINYNLAEKELSIFESFKHSKYPPIFDKQNGHILTGMYEGSVKEIFVGPAAKRGKDLPSGKNLIDYIDKQGRMCLLRFFGDHKERFQTMWILVQCEASP
jgi:hypothetical protein